MLSSLDSLGRAGFTAIAESADGVEHLSGQVERALVRAREGASVRRRPARLGARSRRLALA